MLPIACKWKGIGAATWGPNPWGGGGGGGETEDGTIYILQMGTIWDYSINNSHCISRDFLPNAMFGSRPQRSKEKTAALRHAFLKRWRRQRKTSSN